MKSSNYIILLMLLWFTMASCDKDFLDRAPGVNLTEEQIFLDPVLAAQYANNAYNHLIDEYARFNAHRGITGQAADEAVTGNGEISIRTLTNGTYHDHYERGGASLNDSGDVWNRSYAGIRVTNTMLEKMDNVPWTAAQEPARIKGEMYFVRAFLYFELIKRFGGVPIADRVYKFDEDIDFPRNTYQECLDVILADIARAESLLPDDYNNSNYGRATKGAAMALKARALLFAASKLNNESNDLSKWQAAATAAKRVMELNLYSLQSTYSDMLNVATSPEYIMIKVRGPRAIDGFLLDFAMSPGLPAGGAQGQLNPTQNHVDLYEMQTTGKAITDPTSGYDSQRPYTNRDPRLTANILFNDAPWQGVRMQMWNGGKDYVSGNVTYTATRYYSRKMWPEPYRRNIAGTALVNYIFFRYAEILLTYAEAQNEAVGPDASVYDAVNQIRSRPAVAMPPLPAGLTKDAMRARIRNERAVELAFEDFRWYDIMRWKAGPEIVAQPMYGMNVVRNTNGSFTYNRELLPANMQKVYLDYMHRYPIPRREIYKSKGILLQNPGW